MTNRWRRWGTPGRTEARFGVRRAGNAARMAGGGEHPERIPFYGVCLLSASLLSLWLASSVAAMWQASTIGVLAVLAAGAGFVMTFKDLS
jgi:hypothetical protein